MRSCRTGGNGADSRAIRRFITASCRMAYSLSNCACAFSLFSIGMVAPHTRLLSSAFDVENESRNPSIESACENTR